MVGFAGVRWWGRYLIWSEGCATENLCFLGVQELRCRQPTIYLYQNVRLWLLLVFYTITGSPAA